MPTIHDQALAWAQANSQDPRAQDVLARVWTAKNPQDPRAAQITAKLAAKRGPSISAAGPSTPATEGELETFRQQQAMKELTDPEKLRKQLTNDPITMGIISGGLGTGALASVGKETATTGLSKLLQPAEQKASTLLDAKGFPISSPPPVPAQVPTEAPVGLADIAKDVVRFIPGGEPTTKFLKQRGAALKQAAQSPTLQNLFRIVPSTAGTIQSEE